MMGRIAPELARDESSDRNACDPTIAESSAVPALSPTPAVGAVGDAIGSAPTPAGALGAIAGTVMVVPRDGRYIGTPLTIGGCTPGCMSRCMPVCMPVCMLCCTSPAAVPPPVPLTLLLLDG